MHFESEQRPACAWLLSREFRKTIACAPDKLPAPALLLPLVSVSPLLPPAGRPCRSPGPASALLSGWLQRHIIKYVTIVPGVPGRSYTLAVSFQAAAPASLCPPCCFPSCASPPAVSASAIPPVHLHLSTLLLVLAALPTDLRT